MVSLLFAPPPDAAHDDIGVRPGWQLNGGMDDEAGRLSITPAVAPSAVVAAGVAGAEHR